MLWGKICKKTETDYNIRSLVFYFIYIMEISKNNLSEMSENINILLDKAIVKYLSSDSLPEQCRLKKYIDIWNDFEMKIIKFDELFHRFYGDDKWKWFNIQIYKLGKSIWSISCTYNQNTDRFNLCHRLVSKECPIRWKELFESLSYFINWISAKFPNLKWREIYSRQKQVINRVTEKLWFEIDYDNSNDLWKIRINNPNDDRLQTIDVYILDKKDKPISWFIVSSDLFDKDEIPVLQNLDWVADIVLTKSL